MVIDKIINNNVISAFDENGKEVVIMGRGIGFNQKAGMTLPSEKIEKIFRIKSESLNEQFKELLANMPLEHAQISNAIISYAKTTFKMKLSQCIYITLTDHINFAIERFRQNIHPENALLWEIRRFYNQEYRVGTYAVQLIKERLGMDMGEEEAGFIALHFINAEYDTTLNNALMIPNLIEGILNIVKDEFNLEFDENSLHYERFLTHLKFLLQRVYRHELLSDEEIELANMMKKKYPQEYDCSRKIINYIEQQTKTKISEEEAMYLSIHIRRVRIVDDDEE
ncbi:MAG: PRD domain-containing protein [Acetatifactor sp.]|nr:PRD domain-containing protein [Acetatifactor sp.]